MLIMVLETLYWDRHHYLLFSYIQSSNNYGENIWLDIPCFLRMSFQPMQDQGSDWCQVLIQNLDKNRLHVWSSRRVQTHFCSFRLGVSRLCSSMHTAFHPGFYTLFYTSVVKTAITSSPSLPKGSQNKPACFTALYTALLLVVSFIQSQEALYTISKK